MAEPSGRPVINWKRSPLCPRSATRLDQQEKGEPSLIAIANHNLVPEMLWSLITSGRRHGRTLRFRHPPIGGRQSPDVGSNCRYLLCDLMIVFEYFPRGRGLISADFLKECYDLTDSEVRLVLLLFAGERLRNAAEKLHISYETGRSRLKAVFHKTGATRQTELILMLARSAHGVPPANHGKGPSRRSRKQPAKG